MIQERFRLCLPSPGAPRLVEVQQDLDKNKFYKEYVDLLARPTPAAHPAATKGTALRKDSARRARLSISACVSSLSCHEDFTKERNLTE